MCWSIQNPELTSDYNKESDIRLIKTNPIDKSELCYDNKVPVQLIQYNKETKHSLNTKQINSIVNKIGSECTILAKVFYEFLVEKEK